MTESGDELAQLDFESALRQLEAAVAELESDDVPIERAADLYESAIRLVRHCNASLDRVELRVSRLSLSVEGEPRIEAFEPRG